MHAFRLLMFLQVVKKSAAVNACSALGSMSALSRNIAALLELPLEDQAIPSVTAEISGTIGT